MNFVSKSLPLLILFSCSLPSTAEAKDPVLAKVNGVAIKKSDVEKQLWQSQSLVMTEALIDRQLFIAAAKQAKIKIPKKEIDVRIERIEKQVPEGQSLKEQLKANGLDIKGLREEIGFELLRDRLVEHLAKITVTKEEVQSAFEDNKLRLGQPPAFKLRQIVVSSEKEATDMRIALSAGADFGKLAAAKSLDPASKEKGGELGFVSANVLDSRLVEALMKMEVGAVSPVIQLGQTYLLLNVQDKKDGVPANFPDVAKGIENALRDRKTQQARPVVLKQLREIATIERL